MRVWKRGDINADLGGGKFDKATAELMAHGVENVIWDPHNRSDEHNELALKRIHRGVVTATVANTLNAIAESEVRAVVILLATRARQAFFHVYEGDHSGVGKETRDGWQENRKLLSYVPEISRYFGHVEVVSVGGLRIITAR